MSTITRERVEEFISNPASLVSAEESEILELARIALASLEAKIHSYTFEDDPRPLYVAPPAPANAEPVAWLWSHRKHPSEVTLVRPEDDERAEAAQWSGWSCQALCAAPPAPVAVPSFVPSAIEPDYEVIKGVIPTANPDEYACCIAADMWNACRAAMLQGAEPVTTAYKLRDAVEIIRNSGIEIDAEKIFAERDVLNTPDCWCRTCRPVTVTDMRFVVCPDCGNKRCPHANDHGHACTGSNEPGQEGSAYPAAPRQEVK